MGNRVYLTGGGVSIYQKRKNHETYGIVRRRKIRDKAGSKVQTKDKLGIGKNKGRDQWELELRETHGVSRSARAATAESQGLRCMNVFLLKSMGLSQDSKDREAAQKLINSLAWNRRKHLRLKPEQAQADQSEDTGRRSQEVQRKEPGVRRLQHLPAL